MPPPTINTASNILPTNFTKPSTREIAIFTTVAAVLTANLNNGTTTLLNNHFTPSTILQPTLYAIGKFSLNLFNT